ncbi:NERD domain-containing protein [Burkholderia sp. MS455]|uniref:NERD domain-containing protein n=1 Tax=Burkholderia TaxID=32008 RepID=UPI00092FE531|nr:MULTISPECIES: NERD domain-containing protein [Burkholderia]QRR05589.1 NERD domain-containing protein [Burkholderia sp. MS455]
MTVEIFCRYSKGAKNAAERRVLQRVVEILEINEHPAVVLCDFYCGGQQIDLLVGTEITTLVLQVKSYRHAVSGSITPSERLARCCRSAGSASPRRSWC